MSDWLLHTHKASEPPAPQLDLLRLYWRMVGPSGRPLSCGLYRTTEGLELRCGYSGDDLLRSQLTPDIETASEVAEGWKLIVLTVDSFTELGDGTGADDDSTH